MPRRRRFVVTVCSYGTIIVLMSSHYGIYSIECIFEFVCILYYPLTHLLLLARNILLIIKESEIYCSLQNSMFFFYILHNSFLQLKLKIVMHEVSQGQ